MAKLPGAESLLGGGVSLDSGRPIATFDGTAIGRGMQQFGQGAENAGSNLMNYATTLKDKNDQVLMHDATQRYADFKTTQAQKAADAAVNMPPGGAGVLDAFIPQYQKDADAFAATVPEKFRPQFNAEIHSFAGTLTTSLHGDVLKEQSRFNGQKQDDFTNTRISTAALDPTNTQLTVQQLQDAGNNIRINPNLTPIEKQEKLHSLAQEFAAHIGQAMNESKDGKAAITAAGVGPAPPQQPVTEKAQAITGAASRLGISPEDLATAIMYESGGDVNRRGGKGNNYFGLIQFGPDERAKYGIKPNMTFSQQVDATEQFLKDRGVKPGMGIMDIYSTINAGSPGHYEASDGNGTVRSHVQMMDKNGSRQKAIALLGGTYDPQATHATDAAADPYNTGYKYYRDRFGDGVDPSVLDALAKGYVTGLNQDKAETKANILQASQDAPAAYSNSGQYTGPQPSRADFAQAFGAEGESKYAQYVAGNDAAKSAFDMRTEPVSAIQATVEAAHAQAVGTTGEGAGLAEARYNALSQAAEATMKARLADPVGFTMQAFPKTVGADWDAYKANPTPESYAKAIASTTAAQDQIALPAQSRAYLPGDVAKNAASVFKDPNIPAQQRIGAVVSTVLGTNDAGQQRSIFQQLVKEGLPPESEGAIEAFARGDTGAGNNLMSAVMADPKSLPHLKDVTPEAIKNEIVTNYSDVLNAAYGVELGRPENLGRLQNGSELAVRAVQMRMAQGASDIPTAVKATVQDMFGKGYQVMSRTPGGLGASIFVPAGQDPVAIGRSLDGAQEQVLSGIMDSAKAHNEQVFGPKPIFMADPKPDGLVSAGNIDLTKRPQVKNADGSISTVDSFSYGRDDGKEVLIPSVTDEGKHFPVDSSDPAVRRQAVKEAIAYWQAKGQNLGVFNSPDQADVYAEKLHNQQDDYYLKGGNATNRGSPGALAVAQADATNQARNIFNNGKWVNFNGGYAFVDPYTNLVVPGKDGKPLIVMANATPVAPAPPAASPGQPAAVPVAPAAPATRWDGMPVDTPSPFTPGNDPTATPAPVAPAAPVPTGPAPHVGPDGRKWLPNPAHATDPTAYPWIEAK